MNSNFSKIYWFDFNGTVNENLPLNYNTLKICRNEIKKLEKSNDLKLGSKENPIKLNLTFADKHYRFKKIILKKNTYEVIHTPKFISLLFEKAIESLNTTVMLPIYAFFEFKLKLSTFKANYNHFYIINNKLYITYNDSLKLFTSTSEYIKDLNELNNIKLFFLYRSFNIYNIKFNTLIDFLFLKVILYIHLLYLKSINYSRFDYRLKQTDWGFYINNNTNYSQNLFSGLKYMWRGLRFWFIGLLLGLTSVYYLMFVRLLPFNKIIFAWILVAMFLYWFLSGFVFFVKKYQYSKFTTSIQRFWKRTYIIFWLIEASVFSVFLYLTLNASSEPVYMYDQIKIYKTHLFSWRWFLIKLLPSVSIILLGYYLQLTLKWNLFNKHNTIILLITLLLLYILWLEFYQFYHILSFYGNISWSFDYDEYIWNLELDSRRTRLANNYVAVCLFAKFWHFVFIFLFWVFFVLRVNELGRIRYPLLVANVQNFIIIYIMSWAYMYPWLKFIFRKYLDVPYYWFYLNGRELGVRVFFTDLKLYFYGITNRLFNFSFYNIKFESYPFYYWINSSQLTDFNQYKKFVIRDSIIYSLNNYII